MDLAGRFPRAMSGFRCLRPGDYAEPDLPHGVHEVAWPRIKPPTVPAEAETLKLNLVTGNVY